MQVSLFLFGLIAWSADGFTSPTFAVTSQTTSSRSQLSMVLEKPKQKKLSKLEILKVSSDHLVHPLQEVRAFGVGWVLRFCGHRFYRF